MFIPAFMGFSLLLLVSQASSVKAGTQPSCGQGVAYCCEQMSSSTTLPDQVNDEGCQRYSDPCASGYVPSCCTDSPLLEDYYYCYEATSLI
ncbi:hypothetical protein BDR07DRAFT_1395949 [Suillus spraguei]|nr:hypothetical protein BDR07DRAFT_872791 [Suillus spraguei]KAG2366429.1 hypothetical protein BDR07DRAFT_1395949 [Suillus spraguei]